MQNFPTPESSGNLKLISSPVGQHLAGYKIASPDNDAKREPIIGLSCKIAQ